MTGTAASSAERDDRILRLAESMLEAKTAGHGLQVMDLTSTAWDLAHVSRRVAKELTEAASLADLSVEVYKVGDYARVRFIESRPR